MSEQMSVINKSANIECSNRAVSTILFTKWLSTIESVWRVSILT